MNRTITLFLSAVLLICFTSSKPLDENYSKDETTLASNEERVENESECNDLVLNNNNQYTTTDASLDDCSNSFKNLNKSSSTAELPSGSIIIDMGVTSQSFNNGLKPYGLIYALIKEHSTPVFWSINPTKTKDGIDFNVDGRNFKGGPFAVRTEYLTAAVISEINNWKSKGVVIYKTSSDVTIPIYKELTFFPTWVLDEKNGKIAEKYLTNAGIPSSAYTKALPSALNECHDLFVLPHAEPTWDDHGHLYEWNSPIAEGGNQGYIWSGCTAVSNLENLYNPNNPSQQLNFLSIKAQNTQKNTRKKGPKNDDNYFENALVLADNHEDASNTTHNIDFHTDPFMQFIGQSDGVHKGGKEEIYLPVNGGGWRPTTKVGIWDTNQEDLGTLSAGKAALLLYGPAFGDVNRGQVMYQAGHDLNKDGTTTERVAAQRGFLNFSFDAASAKVPQIVMNNPEQREVTLTNGESITFDVTGIPILGGGITYEWSSTCSIGSFDNTSSATPTFTIPDTPVIVSNQSCIVTVKAMDECGRLAFLTYKINFIVTPITCDITAISASNTTSCNDNGTSTTSDDFFTTDITVTFSTPPNTGFLQLTGDGTASIDVNQLDSATSHTFVGVQLPTNGGAIDFTAFFMFDEEIECTFNATAIVTAPEPCSFTPCTITAISASNTTSCNNNGTNTTSDDFFTTDITVTFSTPPNTGFLQLTGDGTASIDVNQLDSATSHTFVGVQLPTNGGTINFTAFFMFDEEVECTFNATEVVTSPEPCSDIPCSITAISASNTTSCDDNGTNTSTDNFFTSDITISFSSVPTTGILQLTGDGSASVSVNQLDSATSHTFVGVQLPADGGPIDFTAFFIFDEEIECTYNDTTVIMAPICCSDNTCNITSIAASNSTSCNNNGTNTPEDDYFTSDITVLFSLRPTSGILKLTGDGTISINVSELDSDTSHTFIGVQLPADGGAIDLTALFMTGQEVECAYNDTAVTTAPLSCSNSTCTISSIEASNTSSCNDNGTTSSEDDFFTTDITVSFSSSPAAGILKLTGDGTISINVSELDNATSHTFIGVQLPANGRVIDLTAFFIVDGGIECAFNNSTVITAPVSCSFTPCTISSITASNSTSCNDNGTNTPNDDFFMSDITVSFTSPPNSGFLQLSGDGSDIIDVSQLDSATSHTFVGLQLPANGGSIGFSAFFIFDEEITCTFNDTAVVTAPVSCSFTPCTISSIAASNSTSCNDNGTNTPNDDFFMSDITVSFTSPPSSGFLQLSGDGSGIIDVSQLDSATSHTFVGLQLPTNGGSIGFSAFFIFDEEITCTFNDTEVVTAPVSCSFTPCNISSITASNSTSCNDNGTNTPNDDFFMSDITVSFTSPPSSGFLQLSGDGSGIIHVSQLDSATSHTFVGLQLPANGGSIGCSAFFIFDEEITCTFNDTAVVTAPVSCSFTPISCNITAITASNTKCSSNNGSKISNNDFFTTDITIRFSSPPTNGILELTGDGIKNIVRVSTNKLGNDTSYTFIGVQITANDDPIELTAFFIKGEEISCPFNKTVVITCEDQEGEGSLVGDQINFKDLNIYPNPSKGNIIIDTPYVSGEVRVNVTDLTGKIIMNKNIDPKRKSIELNNLPQGIFLIKLNSRNKSIVRKIIID